MGLTVLDSGVLIGFRDANDLHYSGATRELRSAQAHGDSLTIPASALAEFMVDPTRQGTPAIRSALAFIDDFPIQVVPLDREIALEAARLRAQHVGKLKLPDALIVATANALRADAILTTDRHWPAKRSLGFRGNLIVI